MDPHAYAPAGAAADPGAPYRPISYYGLIGDLRTAALVGADGAIDWFCPGRFDAPSLFAALLDDERGGRFQISPATPCRTKQLYLPDTAVLLTRFSSHQGVAELTDLMPVGLDPCAIVRQVAVVRGRVEFDMRCRPAFDYARASHRVERGPAGVMRFVPERGDASELMASLPLEADGPSARTRFTLEAGERAWFVLQPAGAGERWGEEAIQRQIAADLSFWRRWIARSRYDGRWLETVNRSAITLKLCTYAPTGAMVAAPTTSLPETPGGPRNWDYRHAWMRDSAFTAFAFQRLGLSEDAARFSDWLAARCADTEGGPQLQIVYGIDGRCDLTEHELPHLDGYRGSRPVRIGNAAHEQLQLDVYGELMDAVYLIDMEEPISWDLWSSLRGILDWLAQNWDQPDEGIWEVRGGRRDFVYSRLMCWVAFDRAIRIQQKRGFPGETLLWDQARERIYEQIMRRGWSAGRGAFVQYYGGDVLDASNLLMPLVHFVGPRDPRMLATLEAIERDLVSDSLVYRYDPGAAADDGLGGVGEASFALCSFWLVECLTRAGRLEDARLIFEKMLTYASPLGLFAEQVGDTGEALGNYPQAFTHLGLISAAYDLDRALGAD